MTVPPAPTSPGLALTPTTVPESPDVEQLLAQIKAKAGGALGMPDLRTIETAMGMGMYALAEDLTGVRVVAAVEGDDAPKFDHAEAVRGAMSRFTIAKAVKLVSAMTGCCEQRLHLLGLRQLGNLYRESVNAFMDAFGIFNGQELKPAEGEPAGKEATTAQASTA